MPPEEIAQPEASVAASPPPGNSVPAAQSTVPVASAPVPRARWKRVWDWFWLGPAMAELKRASANRVGRCQEFTERARTSFQLGRNVLEPTERDVNSTDPVACDLFRQSAYWSLRGLALARHTDPRLSEQAGDVWAEPAQALVQSTAGDSAALVKKAVDAASFVEFAEMDPKERTQLLPALRKSAEALLEELDRPARAWELLWFKRVLRIGLVFVLLGSAALGMSWAKQASERRNDLAAGKPWRQSSRFESTGCESPQQSCDSSPHFFCHTGEEPSPSLEIDLGEQRRFSAVRVTNREDCCSERAVPLVVEVSVDQKEWRRVARRDEQFSSWLAEFPAVNARWVRLRIERRSYLHLAGVRVLP